MGKMEGYTFNQVESEVDRLRSSMVAGKVTSEQVQDRLRELMVEDDQGRLWTVGFETGDWYRYNGQSWEKDQPRIAEPISAGQYRSNNPAGRWFLRPLTGNVVLLAGLLLTGIVARATPEILHTLFEIHDPEGTYLAIVVALVGLFITIRLTSKFWREG